MFEVELREIDRIEPIEDADKIEVAVVGGYKCIVGKGSYNVGEEVFYIPEAAIVPEDIIKHLGLEGRLAGKENNRVKAIRLRGVLSQGLLLPKSYLPEEKLKEHFEGDYSKVLGITKYDPPIPVQLNGEVISIGEENTIKYDIEDIKKYPNLFGEITPVTITEKIHGTCVQIGILSNYTHEKLWGKNKNIFVASKGLGAEGLVFGTDVDNIYTRCLKDLIPTLEAHFTGYDDDVFFIGEVFGKGVQDLHYGVQPSVRFFDVAYKSRGYICNKDKKALFGMMNLPQVPILYEGRFSMKIVNNLLALDTVEGNKEHMMEGIVIRADNEDERHPRIGRPILKAVSDRYLERKGGTEYN